MALSGTISDDLKAAPDVIWSAQALANAGTITSGEFLFGGVQDALEVVIKANTAISIADGQTIEIAIQGASASGGSFAQEAIIYRGAPSGGTLDFAAGDTIAVFASNRALSVFNKLTITTSADESSEKVDAYMRQASR